MFFTIEVIRQNLIINYSKIEFELLPFTKQTSVRKKKIVIFFHGNLIEFAPREGNWILCITSFMLNNMHSRNCMTFF